MDEAVPATAPTNGGGIDVASLLTQGFRNVVQGIQSIGGQANASASRAGAAEKLKESGIAEESAAKQELSAIELARQVELQKKNVETMGMAGALPGAQSEIMQFHRDTVLSKLGMLGKLQNEVEEAKGIGPFDNPITWLGNAFTMPFKKAKLEQVTNDIKDNLGIVRATQDNTSTAMTQNAAAVVPDLTAKSAALNKQIAAEATQKSAEARTELERFNLSAQQLTLATTTAGFDAIYKLHSAESDDRRLVMEQSRVDLAKHESRLSEERFSLDKLKFDVAQTQYKETKDFERERFTLTQSSTKFTQDIENQKLELDKERLQLTRDNATETKRFREIEERKFELDRQMKAIQISDKIIQDNAIESFNTRLNSVTGPLGMQVKNFFDYKQLSPAAQKGIDDMMINSAVMGGAIGKSPAEVLSKMEAVGSVGGTPGMALVVNTLNKAKASAAVAADGKTPNFLYNQAKPEVKQALENGVIESKVQAEHRNIPTEGGLYSPPPLTTTLRGEVVGKLPLALSLLPLAANPQYSTKPEDIVTAALDRMKKGQGTPATEANQIVTMFKQVTDTLNQSKNYKFFALPELGSTYNMSITDARGRAQVINMLNESQLRAYLTRRATEQQMYDLGPGGMQ